MQEPPRPANEPDRLQALRQLGCGVRVEGSRATIDGLKKEASPRNVAQRRGKKVAEILPSNDKPAAEAVEA